jgi:hypothetical protein
VEGVPQRLISFRTSGTMSVESSLTEESVRQGDALLSFESKKIFAVPPGDKVRRNILIEPIHSQIWGLPKSSEFNAFNIIVNR